LSHSTSPKKEILKRVYYRLNLEKGFFKEALFADKKTEVHRG
jgi:hypothetical protein